MALSTSPSTVVVTQASSVQLTAAQTAALVDDAVVWANQHGLVRGAVDDDAVDVCSTARFAFHTRGCRACCVVRHTTIPVVQVVALKDPKFVNPDFAVIHAPLALTPVPYPKARFELAQKVCARCCCWPSERASCWAVMLAAWAAPFWRWHGCPHALMRAGDACMHASPAPLLAPMPPTCVAPRCLCACTHSMPRTSVALHAARLPVRAAPRPSLASFPLQVQPLFNSLVDAVARDEAYLEATLGGAAK